MHTDVPALAARNGSYTAPETVIKRDGSPAAYDAAKVTRAVFACCTEDCGFTPADAQAVAAQVSTQVARLLSGVESPHVERIQDLVEQQLMALGHGVVAKQYILYRENRRKAREAEAELDPESVRLFRESAKYFTGTNRDLQVVQMFDKFSRFDWNKGRREVWPESVDRVMVFTRKWMDKEYPGAVTESEWQELHDGLLHHEVCPSMRLVQMAGPALERCHMGVYNCSFQFMDGPQSAAEELYCLMQGTGVGFSVEHRHAVDKWPRVKKQRGHAPEKYVIPDTTEGWCDSFKHGLERWLDGGDYDFDDSQIRPAGTILKTKGGRSSGPQCLRDLLTFTRNRILSRQGERLSSLDLHDIICTAHRIVQMGGVRRASGISFSDLDDTLMRGAKDGAFWNAHPYRDQSNNSAVYEEKPSAVEFMEEWLALAKSGSGERGIFNASALKKQLPRRRKHKHMRTNPCGEILLKHKQTCNLSIAVLRPGLPVEEVRRRVRLAALWGTIQSTMTRFNYLCDIWKQNCEEERLLGVDLLGHLDWDPLKPNAPGIETLLQLLRQDAIDENVRLAQRCGINASAAVTCGKPSGDSSCFFDAAPGFKDYHGKHWIRRIRLEPTNPVTRVLKAAGVPHAEDYNKTGILVFDFPCKAPEGAIILGDRDAIAQLEHWKTFKLNFTEHNPSVTIYVRPDEWLRVGHWVYENWDSVGGLSFNPFDGGVYPLAPYETISETEYLQRAAAFPVIDWSEIMRHETEDMTTLAQQFACQGGACAI